MSAPDRTLNMVVAALGGEGGGVFSDWMIDVAEREGWLCQTTHLAGVAQRTGATIYYLEFYPRAALPADGVLPVMSLFPSQGDIDIAVASELAEAARMVQRGFVDPARTTVIASTHRVYAIGEKEQGADGRSDATVLREIVAGHARRFVHFDMQALAEQCDTVISAVLLGAVAGAGVLPFTRAAFERALRAGGKSVDANVAAFEASFARAREGEVASRPEAPAPGAAPAVLPTPTTPEGTVLVARARALPAACHAVLAQALPRLVDYQDRDYAAQFLEEIERVHALDDGREDYRLTRETARWLALWMCFEDVPRVAQLKTRAARLAGIRAEVRAAPGQILHVTEFFSPRVEEICALLPRALGRRLQDSPRARRVLNVVTGGRRLRTDGVLVFLVLRLLGGLRRWRRGSLGYAQEHAMIDRWLTAVRSAAAAGDPGRSLAREIAACGRLVKGYGETRARTTAQLMAILDRVAQAREGAAAAAVATWREAALVSEMP